MLKLMLQPCYNMLYTQLRFSSSGKVYLAKLRLGQRHVITWR